MPTYHWDDMPEEWQKIGNFPCLCGVFCCTESCCAISPELICGEKGEIFCICIEEIFSCICKKPCTDDVFCGCKGEFEWACKKPKLLIQSRALCCCIDERCALPCTEEQPMLCGLFPWIGLIGEPPK